MAEPALKLAEAPAPQEAQAKPAAKSPPKRLRFILLIALPLIAAAVGLYVYLAGGRYISTDNAYVGAQKVLITPDVAGKIVKVSVREGEVVQPGQPLFEIDPEPFRLAVIQVESRVASVRTEFASLKTNLASIERLITLAQETVKLRQADVDRKKTLLTNRSGAQFDVDASLAQLVTAQTSLEQMTQQRDALKNQLLDDPNLPIEKFPAFMQAVANLDTAQRDLRLATVRAPMRGTATQVPSIQLGRYVTAGTPVFALMDDDRPWVDANPKETEVTHLRVGQPVSMYVDAYPDQALRGTVASVSPGTGAQFAILPPQNASGNWVKVVQRLPIRIEFAPGQDLQRLRAGMSVNVDIDTGRKRSLAGLFGGNANANGQKP
ncbi:multidrug export protein EmrA [Variibacter gotjawalensis]|uniref:Multidrug export protein EmrA n=1 Tax=Variibacter gotjawalensis TaxID=1333996 RepID=A0A0S3PPN5_9BRAD|nr:HlyD family secretion protein [Variibacter gotjawalensis]NIK48121.1 membrane fusion protein (multidrug efflux system) [Variibacter gotjawalensis]RZS49997.1 membrane fusion protein (multidrug efflux system) [Variibacter gotjawalensis]BAT57824.1 multidrug export protein EmrA [Variibacter gotjawalensis]